MLTRKNRTRARLGLLLAALLALPACSGGAQEVSPVAPAEAPAKPVSKAPPPAPSAGSSPAAAAAEAAEEEEEAPTSTASRFAGDPRVGSYVSIPWAFTTSSYWIEGPEGVIVIDTQFTPSIAAELITKVEAITNKKVALAIVLHANPDKFNGTATFQQRGIKVVTSEQVKALLPAVHEKRVKAFYERYKPDYPSELPSPDAFGKATKKLSAGGVTVTAHVMGAGCSEAHVVVEFDKHVFAGDLIANGTHSWLEIGRTDEWLKRLKEMRALKPKFVHPGRGPSGGPELLDQEEAYLRKFIEMVAAENPVMPAPPEAIERVKTRIKEAYPNHGFPVFLHLGVPAEWRRQAEAKKNPAAKGPP
jgi:glyoxylase-like metal-dependent hydrolase (beta-lactamase superfamily II)